jgi:hypothetical protein
MFAHEALDRSRDEIRLLRIDRNLSHDQIIQLRLHHASLGPSLINQSPKQNSHLRIVKYNALSYVWGDEKPEHEVLINGSSHFIRHNLYLFLDQARRRARHIHLPIWIDAICINQDNTTERNHQVSRMQDIYRGANEVFIWLGWWPSQDLPQYLSSKPPWRPYEIPGFKWAMPLVRKGLMTINKWPKDEMDYVRWAWTLGRRTPQCVLRMLVRVVKLDKDKDTHNVPEFFVGLASIDYWKRAWVVQEFLLAKRKRIFLASSSMSWEAFHARLSLFSADTFGMTMCSFLYAEIANRCTTLADYYEKFQSQNCAEVRDQLYAIAGLSTNTVPFPIDYGCTDVVAFLNSTFYICYDFCSKCEENLDKVLDFARAITQIVGLHHMRGLFHVQPMASDFSDDSDKGKPDADLRALVKGLRLTEITRPYVVTGPRLCDYDGQLMRLTDTYPLSFLRWPPRHQLKYALTNREWLSILGFRSDDILLPCTDSSYRAYAMAVVLRPSSESVLKIVGRVCVNQYALDWICEAWSDSGLPGVLAHRIHRDWHGEEDDRLWHSWHNQAFELVFTSLRPFVILFGMSAGFGKHKSTFNFDRNTGYRAVALQLVAWEAQDPHYLPTVIKYVL